MTVRVIDSSGNVLMPTKRLGRVRHMLASGAAEIICYHPFTIKLTRTVENIKLKPFTVGVDCGFKHTGISISNEYTEVYSAEFSHRSGDIKRLLEARREARCSRRSRKTPYRKPKFKKQSISNIKEGWIPPTARHMIESHMNDLRLACKYLPVKEIVLETGGFDTHKLRNPEVEGEDYQNGLMKDFESNAKAFARWRDKNTCQKCKGKSENKKIEVHHIKFVSNGGTNHPNNLICLCHDCHTKLHHSELDIKKEVKALGLKTMESLRAAAAMSVTHDMIVEEAKRLFPGVKVRKTYGYITKMRRKKYNIEKSHTNDAYVIAGNLSAQQTDETYIIKRNRRHNRKISKDTIYKGGKKKRNQAAYFIKGFALNDCVMVDNEKIGFIVGRMSSGYASVRTIDGKPMFKSVLSMKRLKLIRHSNGFIYERIKK